MKVDFFVSDDVRPEANGKMILIGVYPASTIVIEKEVSHLIVGENRNPSGIALDQLNITFVVSKVDKVTNCKIEMHKEEDNLSLEQTFADVEIKKAIAHTVNMNLRPFVIVTPGTITVKFTANEKTFDFEINIITRDELDNI